jgi:hypothetical protein
VSVLWLLAGCGRAPEPPAKVVERSGAEKAAEQEGGDRADNAAAQIASERDFAGLLRLVSPDGEPLDESSRRTLQDFGRKLESDLLTRDLPGESDSLLEGFEQFASADPWGAASVALALPPQDGGATALWKERAGWHAGKNDRARALALMLATGTRNREAALAFAGGVMEEWKNNDLLSAAEWIEQVAPQYPQLPELAALVAAELAAKSPLEATAWLQRLPRSYADAASAQIAAGWAESDPVSALVWSSRMPTGDTREEALEQASVAGAQSRPEETMAWLVSPRGPPGPVRDDLVRTAATAWARQDPAAVQRWIVENQQSADIVPAVQGLAGALARRKPLLAVESALDVADDPRGQAALRSALENWRKDRYADFLAGTAALEQRLREEGRGTDAAKLRAALQGDESEREPRGGGSPVQKSQPHPFD